MTDCILAFKWNLLNLKSSSSTFHSLNQRKNNHFRWSKSKTKLKQRQLWDFLDVYWTTMNYGQHILCWVHNNQSTSNEEFVQMVGKHGNSKDGQRISQFLKWEMKEKCKQWSNVAKTQYVVDKNKSNLVKFHFKIHLYVHFVIIIRPNGSITDFCLKQDFFLLI